MRRTPYLSLLLALAIGGGMLALFPTVWMLLVIALLALITLQWILIRRNLYRMPAGSVDVPVPPTLDPGRRAAAEAATRIVAAAAAQAEGDPAQSEGSTAVPDAAAVHSVEQETAAGAPSAADGRANIDTELFSRFRQHLEEAEAGGQTPRPERPETPPPLDEDESGVRVNLSSAARRGPAGQASAQHHPVGERTPPSDPAPRARPSDSGGEDSDGDDLFEDLRPAPVATSPTASDPPQAVQPPQQGETAAEPAADSGGQPAHPTEQPTTAEGLTSVSQPPAEAPTAIDPATPNPPAGRGSEDSAESAAGLADEAAALLNMAEAAASRSEYDGLRASLGNYFSHLESAPQLVDWRARGLQVQLAVHDGDSNGALQAFEGLLATGHQPAVDDVPGLLDSLLHEADERAAASLRVSLLVRILAVYRQTRDQQAMDRCYGWIEEAQEQVGDERRLLQYLKNHLEIRKVLGDVPGQLELIDQLGNRCYRLGLTDEAKTYYEMGLRLRAENEQGPASAAREG